jgi:SAM-dependent methyltransferase
MGPREDLDASRSRRAVSVDQKSQFVQTDGDEWFRRNAAALADRAATDLLLAELERTRLRAATVLEIGCANGWRLETLRQRWNAHGFGIEPSAEAVREGQRLFPALDLRRGTADMLPFEERSFDIVIFGFCLYLCDRDDLFRIAAEADRVLRPDGHIVIFDFQPPTPYRNAYQHRAGLFSYKMDHSRLFTWNPAYQLTSLSKHSHDGGPENGNPDDTVSIAVVKKSVALAYPDNPYRAR